VPNASRSTQVVRAADDHSSAGQRQGGEHGPQVDRVAKHDERQGESEIAQSGCRECRAHQRGWAPYRGHCGGEQERCYVESAQVRCEELAGGPAGSGGGREAETAQDQGADESVQAPGPAGRDPHGQAEREGRRRDRDLDHAACGRARALVVVCRSSRVGSLPGRAPAGLVQDAPQVALDSVREWEQRGGQEAAQRLGFGQDPVIEGACVLVVAGNGEQAAAQHRALAPAAARREMAGGGQRVHEREQPQTRSRADRDPTRHTQREADHSEAVERDAPARSVTGPYQPAHRTAECGIEHHAGRTYAKRGADPEPEIQPHAVSETGHGQDGERADQDGDDGQRDRRVQNRHAGRPPKDNDRGFLATATH
jgi:hypothetical protein